MNTSDIKKELKGVKLFRKVVPRDGLPKIIRKKPAAYVFNTDCSDEPGEHWIAIIVYKSKVEYFDPLGFPPVHDEIIRFILGFKTRKFFYSANTIQNPESNLCGRYCIAFIKHKSRHQSMKSFIDQFSRNTIKNDYLVKKLSRTGME